jgi:hypothetical protein
MTSVKSVLGQKKLRIDEPQYTLPGASWQTDEPSGAMIWIAIEEPTFTVDPE